MDRALRAQRVLNNRPLSFLLNAKHRKKEPMFPNKGMRRNTNNIQTLISTLHITFFNCMVTNG